MVIKNFIATLLFLVLFISSACTTNPTTTTPITTTTPAPTVVQSQYQIEYELFSRFPDFFYCDPDFYPIGRDEQANALEQFDAIKSNPSEFSAILEHINLPLKTEYTDSEKLNIYREHKKLSRGATMTPAAANSYTFTIRTGENEGLLITGTIEPGGRIKIHSQETSFNTCPICLTRGTLIDTPTGFIPVEQVQPGMLVWTLNTAGQRFAAPVIKTSSTPVPDTFKVLRITLDDGRTMAASPGHPSAVNRPLGDYHIGDTLDNGQIVSLSEINYDGGATYDLLPAGETGHYWANGILLGSTLQD